MQKHKYGMRLRGYSPWCQPEEGLIEVKEGKDRYKNILIYNRKLTQKELHDYELNPIGSYYNAYGEKLCSNCEGIIVFPEKEDEQELCENCKFETKLIINLERI